MAGYYVRQNTTFIQKNPMSDHYFKQIEKAVQVTIQTIIL